MAGGYDRLVAQEGHALLCGPDISRSRAGVCVSVSVVCAWCDSAVRPDVSAAHRALEKGEKAVVADPPSDHRGRTVPMQLVFDWIFISLYPGVGYSPLQLVNKYSFATRRGHRCYSIYIIQTSVSKKSLGNIIYLVFYVHVTAGYDNSG